MSYIQERDSILAKAKQFLHLADSQNCGSLYETIQGFIDRINKDQFVITIVGEFSRGKSTILNAILGADIIPTAVAPTTATLNIIHYSDTPFLKVHFRDGSKEDLEFNKSAFKEFTGLVDFDPSTIKYMEMGYPVDYLKDGTVLVDTPGVNDIDEQRMDITYGYMPVSDATVFIFNASTPFRRSEQEFLSDHVLTNNIPKLFFVVNRIDEVDPEDLDEVTDDLQNKLKAILKVDEVELHPISARSAFRAGLANDAAMLAKSGFVKFEESLKEFILGGEKYRTKLEGLQTELHGICELLLEHTAQEKRQLALSEGELQEAISELENVGREKRVEFSKLLQYLDEQREIVMSKLLEDLQYREGKLVASLIDDLDGCLIKKQDIGKWANHDLQRKVKNSVESGMEYAQAHVKKGCQDLAHVGGMGFRKKFSKRSVIDGVFKGITFDDNLGSLDVRGVEVDAINNVTNWTEGACAVLVGGLFGVFSGGIGAVLMPALVAGGLGKRILGSKFAKDKREEQYNKVQNFLPSEVSKQFSSMYGASDRQSLKFLQAFKQSLSIEFEGVLNEIEASLKQKALSFGDAHASAEDQRKNLDKTDRLIREVMA